MKISLRKQMVMAFMVIIALFGGGLYGYNSYRYPKQSYEYCKKIVKVNITLRQKLNSLTCFLISPMRS